jgi:crossover junction endodeoxyribonuclease RuvC
VVIGVDPGLASTGWAVVEGRGSRLRAVAWGTLRTSPRTPQAERLLALNQGIAEVLAAHACASVAMEAWFIHAPSRAAMGMSAARGALMVAMARAGLAVVEYSPNAVKQAVTGNGRADKAQVRAMVSRLTGVDPGSDHAADAMAAAICHCAAGPLQAAVAGA